MIVVDTSALMAILLREPQGADCVAAVAKESAIAISSATLAEALVVAARRNLGDEMDGVVVGLGLEMVSVKAASARGVAFAYERWGKGVQRTGLNIGDCFAYSLAMERQCGLLYVGSDCAQTDVRSALPG